MKCYQKALVLSVLLLSLLAFAPAVFANKSAVVIDALASAAKGSEITIRITVTHDGNSIMHYTDWAYVKVNGKEVGRWQFTSSNRPESEKFSREVKVKVDGNLEITAEANCNIHGSAGTAKAAVAAQ